jgi:cytochrome oxidase Cu insertion factor (SCO1/SenC/PrrC family)
MRIWHFAAIVAIAVMCGREGAAAAKVAAAPPVTEVPAQTAAATSELAAAQGAPAMSGHFALQTLDGREVTDATYRGKWLLVYFGYTSCPDVCPTVLLRVGQALDSLGKLAERVQPIFITVDPARDTKERLSKYMAAFNPHIIGLRGSPDQIKEAARQFHVYYRARSLGNDEYTVDHSSFLYVVTPEGHFEKLLADSLPVDQLVAENARESFRRCRRRCKGQGRESPLCAPLRKLSWASAAGTAAVAVAGSIRGEASSRARSDRAHLGSFGR